jgi:hypothetical protein
MTTHTAALSPSKFLFSLTGFEEIGVARLFGAKAFEMREDPISLGRAMAYVHFRREGEKDKAAFDAAMNKTIQEIVDFFPPEEEEPAADPFSDADPNPSAA